VQLTSAGKVSTLVRPPNPPLIINPGTAVATVPRFAPKGPVKPLLLLFGGGRPPGRRPGGGGRLPGGPLPGRLPRCGTGLPKDTVRAAKNMAKSRSNLMLVPFLRSDKVAGSPPI